MTLHYLSGLQDIEPWEQSVSYKSEIRGKRWRERETKNLMVGDGG